MTPRVAFRPLVVVAAVAAFGLTACGSTPSDSGGSGGSGATSGGAAAAGVTLIASGKLTACTHLPYAPFQSNDDQGKTDRLRRRHDRPRRQEAGRRADHRRHPVRGHQVGSGPVHRQVRHRRRGHDDHRRAQEGHPLLAALLRRDAGAAGQEGLHRQPRSPTSRARSWAPSPRRPVSTTRSPRRTRTATRSSSSRTSPLRPRPCTTGQVDAAINDLPVWTEAIKENPGGRPRSRPSSTPASSTGSA